jgi:hypothetical protein
VATRSFVILIVLIFLIVLISVLEQIEIKTMRMKMRLAGWQPVATSKVAAV